MVSFFIDVIFIILGYLSGSVLYARVFCKLIKKRDVTKDGKDRNPGTANAYMHGGFFCGTLTLICDFFKGAIPVWLYLNLPGERSAVGLPLVMLSVIMGHMFPLFFGFRGGKGIASTFGVLCGLFSFESIYAFGNSFIPFGILALCFIFFSSVIRVRPNIYRTYMSYFAAGVLIFLLCDISTAIGFAAITVGVFVKLFVSKEDKSGFGIKVLWMR